MKVSYVFWDGTFRGNWELGSHALKIKSSRLALWLSLNLKNKWAFFPMCKIFTILFCLISTPNTFLVERMLHLTVLVYWRDQKPAVSPEQYPLELERELKYSPLLFKVMFKIVCLLQQTDVQPKNCAGLLLCPIHWHHNSTSDKESSESAGAWTRSLYKTFRGCCGLGFQLGFRCLRMAHNVCCGSLSP